MNRKGMWKVASLLNSQRCKVCLLAFFTNNDKAVVVQDCIEPVGKVKRMETL